MHTYTQERAVFAANALVFLAIALGTLSFWSDAIAAGDILAAPIDWLIAAILTVAMLSVSFLLSGMVVRYSDAREHHPVTAKLVIVLGIVLGLIEGGMTHEGLAWLDARKDIAPEWILVIASFGLSAFNVFALYTFGRDLPRPKAPPQPVLQPVAVVNDPSTDESPATIAARNLAGHRWNNVEAA